MDKVEAEI